MIKRLIKNLMPIAILLGSLGSCKSDLNPTSILSNSTSNSFDSSLNGEISSGFSSSLEENTSDSNNLSDTSIKEERKDELLENTSFTTLDSWVISSDDDCVLNTIENGEGILKLQVDNNNAKENYSVQVKQDGIILVDNESYIVDFLITSSVSRKINFIIQEAIYYSRYLINETFEVLANVQYHYRKEFIATPGTNHLPYLYGFMLGKIDGETNALHQITISNPSLLGYNAKIVPCVGLDGTITPAPTTSHNRTLVWNDEFNGNSVDESKWTFELGNGNWGWGNNEQQYYRKENATVNNGSLKITALNERFGNFNYTSSRMITKGKFSFHYGYVEARLALPRMMGIWPAFWMLGANIDQVNWPSCGEIDIMEAINIEEKVHTTVHWNDASHKSSSNNGYDIDYRTDYHVYGMEWDEKQMVFYLDNVKTFTFGIATNDGRQAFQKDFFFLLNVAVGGQWPGYNIDDCFPQAMSVDYVRVYQ